MKWETKIRKTEAEIIEELKLTDTWWVVTGKIYYDRLLSRWEFLYLELTVEREKVIAIFPTEQEAKKFAKYINKKAIKFCSNKENIIKLINPRGNFGGLKGIYGDRIYDIVKLCQSFNGFYDFIIQKNMSLIFMIPLLI